MQEGTVPVLSITTVTITENEAIMTSENANKISECTPDKDQLCPVRDIMARFGDKWSIYVILNLGKQERLRFNELKSMISGISQRMLTVTLRSLEEDGLLSRTVYPEIPPRVEYALTELGRDLLQKLLHLTEWAQNNIEQVLEARARYAVKQQRH